MLDYFKIMTEIKGKLLLVDDEPDILLFLKELLQYESYQVMTALSGVAALAELAKQQIDIIITDIRMPGMEGIELIKNAGELQPSIQSIVMTGHGDINTAINAIKLGAANYLPKPINMDELLVALERTMEKIRLKNDLIESEKKLRQANENLEKKIEQRTSELSKTVAELRLFAEVFKNSTDSIVITDRNGTIQMVNPGFCKFTGYKSEEAIGQNPKILKSGHHDQDFFKKFWDSLVSKGTWDGEIWNRKKKWRDNP